jgi:hypothetical protein
VRAEASSNRCTQQRRQGLGPVGGRVLGWGSRFAIVIARCLLGCSCGGRGALPRRRQQLRMAAWARKPATTTPPPLGQHVGEGGHAHRARAHCPPNLQLSYLPRPSSYSCRGAGWIATAAADAFMALQASFTSPSQPKIFPLPPITLNLSTHAWSIKCR